jgi:sRNA-binding carbon storage regulator CsrA
MLVVSRKEHESIKIEPLEGLDRTMTLREAVAHGPVLVRLVHVGHKRVRLSIDAPPPLQVRRDVRAAGGETAPAAPSGAAQPKSHEHSSHG